MKVVMKRGKRDGEDPQRKGAEKARASLGGSGEKSGRRKLANLAHSSKLGGFSEHILGLGLAPPWRTLNPQKNQRNWREILRWVLLFPETQLTQTDVSR